MPHYGEYWWSSTREIVANILILAGRLWACDTAPVRSQCTGDVALHLIQIITHPAYQCHV